MDAQEFNTLSVFDAEELVRPCLDVQRWIDEVITGRPYNDVEEIISRADESGRRLTPTEVVQALAHHPRIGERAQGTNTEAKLSRDEQAGLDIADEDVQTQLARGNAEYEEQFDQVFLIRAAGRSSRQILTELRRRQKNSPEQEAVEVADQLRQIALLRLKGLFS